MANAEKKNELAQTTGGELQVSGLFEQLAGLASDGFDNVSAEDVSIPFINILQSNSPQCDKKKEEYDPSVSEGQFYNSAQKTASDKLVVIPVGFDKSYVEWSGPAGNQNSKFVARHPANAPIISKAVVNGNKLLLEGGHELVETKEHYFLVLPQDGSPSYVALMPLKTTGIKHSKRFINEMNRHTITDPQGNVRRAPMCTQKYELSTQVESNSYGAWHSLGTIKHLGQAEGAELTKAIAAAQQFSSMAQAAAGGFKQDEAYRQGGTTTTATDTTVADLMS